MRDDLYVLQKDEAYYMQARETLKKEYPKASSYRLNSMAKCIVLNKPEELAVYASGDFRTKKQIQAIDRGFQKGLSSAQVMRYAKTVYTGRQMAEICEGMLNGLTDAQVQLFSDPAFTAEQMRRIRCDLEAGFSIEDVKSYAHKELSVTEMSEANRQLLRRQAPQVIDPDAFLNGLGVRFRKDQIKQIRLGALHGLNEKQLLLYADRKWDSKQMRQLRLGMENGLSDEQLCTMCVESYSWWRMEQIRECLEKGVPHGLIELLTTNEIDEMKSNSIAKALLAGLEENQVRHYMDLNLGGFQLGLVFYGLLHDYSEDQLHLLTKKYFSDEFLLNQNMSQRGFTPRQYKLLCRIMPPASDWLFASKRDVRKQDIE